MWPLCKPSVLRLLKERGCLRRLFKTARMSCAASARSKNKQKKRQTKHKETAQSYLKSCPKHSCQVNLMFSFSLSSFGSSVSKWWGVRRSARLPGKHESICASLGLFPTNLTVGDHGSDDPEAPWP